MSNRQNGNTLTFSQTLTLLKGYEACFVFVQHAYKIITKRLFWSIMLYIIEFSFKLFSGSVVIKQQNQYTRYQIGGSYVLPRSKHR